MVMPKKGTRKIKVDDKEYLYKVTSKKHSYHGAADTRLLVELGTDNYYTETRGSIWEVTPAYVYTVVKKSLANG